jgi:steroid delta-isomerase-like uncharacterized protein
MAMPMSERMAARLALVEEYIAHENRQDLDGIIGTFGATAHYDDVPWSDHHDGRDGVRAFYAELLRAMPDLQIEVRQRHVTATIVLEAMVTGRHLGAWRDLPPTSRKIAFPLCAIFTFDDDDRLAGEKIYYDRATVLRQLGVFHEPDHGFGRLNAVLMHPLTMARVVGRMLWR